MIKSIKDVRKVKLYRSLKNQSLSLSLNFSVQGFCKNNQLIFIPVEDTEIQVEKDILNIYFTDDENQLDRLHKEGFFQTPESEFTLVVFLQNELLEGNELNLFFCDLVVSGPLTIASFTPLIKKIKNKKSKIGYLREIIKAKSYKQQGLMEVHIDLLTALIDLKPKVVTAYCYLVDAYINLSRYPDAYVCVEKALHIWPTSYFLLDRLFRILSVTEFEDEARSIFEKLKTLRRLKSETVKFITVNSLSKNDFELTEDVISYYKKLERVHQEKLAKVVEASLYIYIKFLVQQERTKMISYKLKDFFRLTNDNKKISQLLDFVAQNHQPGIDHFYNNFPSNLTGTLPHMYCEFIINKDNLYQAQVMNRCKELIDDDFETDFLYKNLLESLEKINNKSEYEIYFNKYKNWKNQG